MQKLWPCEQKHSLLHLPETLFGSNFSFEMCYWVYMFIYVHVCMLDTYLQPKVLPTLSCHFKSGCKGALFSWLKANDHFYELKK